MYETFPRYLRPLHRDPVGGSGTLEPSFNLTPGELVTFHECLSSKVCIRVFQALKVNGTLNVSAISRKVGCNNNDSLRHLRKLSELGIIQEEFYAERHTFTLKRGDSADLMKQAIRIVEKGDHSM